jgi:hypothetical protein
MPASERSKLALASMFLSRSRPIPSKNGAEWPALIEGLAVCAATQIEQEELLVGLGWLWVDSTAAVHSIRDRQSHPAHRIQRRILGCICMTETSGRTTSISLDADSG